VTRPACREGRPTANGARVHSLLFRKGELSGRGARKRHGSRGRTFSSPGEGEVEKKKSLATSSRESVKEKGGTCWTYEEPLWEPSRGDRAPTIQGGLKERTIVVEKTLILLSQKEREGLTRNAPFSKEVKSEGRRGGIDLDTEGIAFRKGFPGGGFVGQERDLEGRGRRTLLNRDSHLHQRILVRRWRD